MKVQITAKVETYVTMVVDVPDDSPNTVESAMNEVLADTDYSYDHEAIVETEMVDQEVSSYTKIGHKYHFRCECGKVHKMGAYCVAQLASGHSLTFTGCDCGATTDLEPKMLEG